MLKKEDVDPKAFKFKVWLQEHYNLRTSTVDLYTVMANAFIRDYQKLTYRNCSRFLLANKKRPLEQTRNYARKYAMMRFLEFSRQPELNKQLGPLYASIRMPGSPRYDKEITDLRAFADFVDRLELKLRVACMVMLDTGCRIQAILDFQANELREDDDGYYIVLHEGRRLKKTLNRYMEDETAYLLEKYLKAARFTYPFREKMPKKDAYYTMWTELKNASRESGLVDPAKQYGISFHWLRTTRARTIYRKYKDLLLVKKFLGHTSITTTMRYIEEGKDISSSVVKGEHKWK
jgi:integrase